MLPCVLVSSCKFVDGGNGAAFVHPPFQKDCFVRGGSHAPCTALAPSNVYTKHKAMQSVCSHKVCHQHMPIKNIKKCFGKLELENVFLQSVK